jgi:FkbM family methyltransferase
MSNLFLDEKELSRWIADKGDYTHNITYDLNENSIVVDLGGYTGIWAEQIIDKYNPNIYIVEPVIDFYEKIIDKFSNNNKIHLLNVGISTENKNGFIFIDGDRTSSNLTKGKCIEVEFNTIDTILNKWGLDNVDLLQINIEGDEYPLLENMLETGSINKFKNIQVQFHLGIENDLERRDKIRKGLEKNNFAVKFDYPFVWESWYKIN